MLTTRLLASYSFGVASYHEWLQPTDPLSDKPRIEYEKGYDGEKYLGWCKWVFSNDAFKTWRHGEHSKLLWIHGDAGTGKTMLLAGIIDELNTQHTDGGKSTTVAYHFCEARGKRTKVHDATAVFRGLIALLFEGSAALGLRPNHRKCPSESYAYGSENAVFALTEQLKDMVLALNHTVYFIIDAYDEYGDLERCKDVLRQIKLVSSECTKARWLISSRRNNINIDIETWYKKWGERATGLFEIGMSSPALAPALDQYIDQQLATLPWFENDSKLHRELKQLIRDKANSRFFWVAFIRERLEGVEHQEAIDVIRRAPDLLSPGSKSIGSVQERYMLVDSYAKEGYDKYIAFKKKVNMAHSDVCKEGPEKRESSRYCLLEESIIAHKKAIEKAKEAHPHYHAAIIRAEIGAAESNRELSHSGAFSPGMQLIYIERAESHIESAITRSRDFGYGTREQRAKYEQLIIATRKVIIQEEMKRYLGDKELRTILLGRAYECRRNLNKAVERSTDANIIRWTKWWLSSLNDLIGKLQLE